MIMRKAAAALAASCTVIIKPSPETPLSVLALVELAQQAGFANGVLNVLTTNMQGTPEVSEALCKHDLERKVTFTSSTAIRSLIARHCSYGLKKLTLELDGNCSFLVFDDGDLNSALNALMILKWRTASQACSHANRIYVQSGTTMGPLTTPRGIKKLERLIKDACSKGAVVKTGGRRPFAFTKGNFFEPTVISGMMSDMLASREEIFGPLLCLYRFETEEEAVKAVNATSMGLAS
ncbi:hypothetical protein EKO04_007214 [Ascochyta lentis]|uniref:Aldehyde dehydrogenase domain-containing protein n=1 Tax=Ascochyta lentis TaxID=205686 RepID=A0A8H7MCR2_9PLEO|nr:hypothetical protein EKO04_007214 [Ascochyta lentis]